jgi:hypothetical protein
LFDSLSVRREEASKNSLEKAAGNFTRRLTEVTEMITTNIQELV